MKSVVEIGRVEHVHLAPGQWVKRMDIRLDGTWIGWLDCGLDWVGERYYGETCDIGCAAAGYPGLDELANEGGIWGAVTARETRRIARRKIEKALAEWRAFEACACGPLGSRAAAAFARFRG